MNRKRNVERFKWFKEAKFGMFIHWGVYSVIGRGEWVKHHENMPDEDPRSWKEYIEYIHTQVRELCTQYGGIDWSRRSKKSGPGIWQNAC